VNLSVPNNDGNSLWRWDVGSATNYTINPTLELDVATLGEDTVGDGRDYLLNVAGVMVDADYSSQFNQFYLTQRRSDGNESGLVIVSLDGGTPVVEWSSRDFAFANGLDGSIDNPDAMITGIAGFQDPFREVGSATLSPDGSTLFGIE
jgi:hypothetical protein